MSDPEAPGHIWLLEWPSEWTTWCPDPDPDGEHPDSIEYVRADTIESLPAEREREVVERCAKVAEQFDGCHGCRKAVAQAIRQTITDDPMDAAAEGLT